MNALPKPCCSEKKIVKVIFDSNALFIPLQFNIDIFNELSNLGSAKFQPVILVPVLKEIENLAKHGSPMMQKKAKYALSIAGKAELLLPEGNEHSVDDIIVRTANELKCAVLTNDKALRKRLRDINVPVIYVRQKSHLVIEGRL